jgi:ATP-dependent Lhr-like helicase
MLDELCASGDFVWIGAGATGATDGRVVLCFRDQADLLAPVATEPPSGPVVDALREHLERAGASFWPELLRAAGEPDERVVLDALWELAWAGVVTNDGLGALRARLAGRARAPRGRPRPGRLTRLGPPAAAGRWSLVPTSVGTVLSTTELTMARARQLLDRHGVVTRETVRAEGWPGGFAAVYPALRAMEEAGRARRGYFVAGLGAAQFALPGAADRLRGERATDSAPVVVAATDPAQLYGAALPWPDSAGRPLRAPGALVALYGGAPVAYLEKGARRLLTFGAEPALWIEALTDLVKNGRLRALTLERIDDVATRESPAVVALRSAGFVDSYRGLRFGP